MYIDVIGELTMVTCGVSLGYLVIGLHTSYAVHQSDLTIIEFCTA